MTAIQRFAIHGTIMNPHSSGPYVRHEDHLAAMQARCLAQIEEPAQPVAPQGVPVGEIVLFGGDLKEVSWAAGKMPLPGTKLYAGAAPAAVAGPAWDKTRDSLATLLLGLARRPFLDFDVACIALDAATEPGMPLAYMRGAPAAPALEAPAAPVTLMTEDQASRWAWDQIREEVGTKDWTAGDSSNFFGFFLHGWNYRGQYELQRPAAMARAALAAAPQAPAAPVGGNWIAADDVRRLVRELDVALHGEADAAPQASLCDIVGLTKAAASKLGRPVLVAPAEPEMDARDISASRPLVVILENANRGAKWTASSNRSRCLVVGQRSAEEALRRALVDAGAQAAPAAPAVDAETVKKAARYDWLRDFHNGPDGVQANLPHIAAGSDNDLVWALIGEDADAGIDAAIAAQAKEGGA